MIEGTVSGTGQKKHHWIPEFVQKTWEDQNGQFKAWAIEDNGVRSFRTNASGMMRQQHLYKAEGVENRNIVEDIISAIENAAKPALVRLLQGNKDIPEGMRHSWVRFLLLQRTRIPKRIAWMREQMHLAADFHLNERIPDAYRTEEMDENETFRSLAQKHAPHYVDNGHLELMLKMCQDMKNIRPILQSDWVVGNYELPELIIGDDPIVFRGSLSKPPFMLAIPISPTKLFYVESRKEAIRHLMASNSRDIVQLANESQVIQAERFVIGNISQNFIRNRLHLRRHDNA